MASNPTWTIVEFAEDGTVEAVPTNWIDGDKCYWPNLPRSRMARAIKNCEAVHASSPVHIIKHFENATYDDYARARLMAIRAEDTSDLQSDPEHKDKRRKIPRQFSSSEDESAQESSSLPRAPIMKKNIGTSATFQTLMPLTAYNGIAEGSSGSTASSGGNAQDATFQTLMPLTAFNGIAEGSSGSTASSGGNAQDAVVLTPLAPLITCNSIAEESGGSTASSGGNAQDGTNKEIMAQLRMIITQNHLLRAITSDTQERLRKLEEKLQSVVDKGQPTEISFFSKFNYLEFPINSLENKKNFEIILEDNQNFEDAAKEISKFGGRNNYDFVKRAMTTLLTNEMALKFSWFGRKGKLIFHTSIIAKLVISAAEKTQIEGCMKTTEGNIQQWLKRAYDRQHAQQKKFGKTQ